MTEWQVQMIDSLCKELDEKDKLLAHLRVQTQNHNISQSLMYKQLYGSTMVLAREKHGDMLYKSAVSCLAARITDGYWYDADETKEAKEALGKGEDTAWRFLRSRNDYEYESVEQVYPK